MIKEKEFRSFVEIHNKNTKNYCNNMRGVKWRII